MSSAVPVLSCLNIYQPDVRLVNQGGGLQRVGLLASQPNQGLVQIENLKGVAIFV